PRFQNVVNLVCSKKKRLILRTSMPAQYHQMLELHVRRAMAEQTSLPMNFAPDEILRLDLDSDDIPFHLPPNFTTLFPHITQLIIIAHNLYAYDTVQKDYQSNHRLVQSILVSLPQLELLKLVTMTENNFFSTDPPKLESLPHLKHLSMYCFMEKQY